MLCTISTELGSSPFKTARFERFKGGMTIDMHVGRHPTPWTTSMNDLTSLSLKALMRVATHTNLVDDCRMTEWVVILRIDELEIVLNHDKAHVFLQGLIRGSLRQQQLAEGGLRKKGDSGSVPWASEVQRHQIG